MKKTAATICTMLLGGAALIGSPAAHARPPEAGQQGPDAVAVPDPPEVLTANEAALLLRVDENKLRDLASTGEVPGRLVGNQWRFSRAALLGWLAGYRQGRAAAERRLVSIVPPSDQFARMRPLDARGTAAVVGRGLSGAAQATQQVGAPVSDAPIGTAPKGRTASEAFLRDQRILLAPKELTIDFGLFYARNDDLILGTTGTFPTLGLVESDTLAAFWLVATPLLETPKCLREPRIKLDVKRSSQTASQSAAVRAMTWVISGSGFDIRSSMKGRAAPMSFLWSKEAFLRGEVHLAWVAV